jgi:hypothetical protein
VLNGIWFMAFMRFSGRTIFSLKMNDMAGGMSWTFPVRFIRPIVDNVQISNVQRLEMKITW